jgi:hypothetical protein
MMMLNLFRTTEHRVDEYIEWLTENRICHDVRHKDMIVEIGDSHRVFNIPIELCIYDTEDILAFKLKFEING